jgi:molybdate transport system permease protein
MHGYWPLLLQIPGVAGAATLISLAGGLWLGHWFPRNPTAAAVAWLALMLPPTVICGYFLLPVFTPPVATAAATLYGLPFLGRSAWLAFGSLRPDYANGARSSGASEWRVFWRVTLPLAYRPVLASAGIVFGRILTEYAATLWIAAGRGSHP